MKELTEEFRNKVIDAIINGPVDKMLGVYHCGDYIINLNENELLLSIDNELAFVRVSENDGTVEYDIRIGDEANERHQCYMAALMIKQLFGWRSHYELDTMYDAEYADFLYHNR